MNKHGRWRIGALASAIALLGGLASLEAHALVLGRITVQSALGEPLRAEIDITDISPAEAASLRAGVASPDTFKAAGLEYNQAISGLEVNLQRRADGRAYLRLSSNRQVTEPFVDLILEANWTNGRITRDYTMLFDPPALRSANASETVAPTAPVLSRPAAPSVVPFARGITSPTPPAAPSTRPSTTAAPVARAPATGSMPSSDKQVTVKAGDTAGKIAAQTKPASVSLDQMLVALLRSNPDAFIQGNINRLKSGAVLDVPTEEVASAVSAREASQTVLAQSRDFNSFRRKLAESVPAAQTAGADRQAGGKVQAKVEDRAPASATPDKLTLSKGAVQGKATSAAEEKIAQERQARDASTRVAELNKNISDLNKLGVGTAAPATAPGAGAAVMPPAGAVPVPAPAVVVTAPTPMPAPVAAASAPLANASLAAAAPTLAASDSMPAAAASAPAATPAPVPVVKKAAPPPPPEPSLLDELLGNPLLLPIGGLLALLLAGFGFYRYRQRQTGAQLDSSFLESRLQPDSFFGASGGQRIDTNEGNVTGSSLVYSPSQLDAAGDVDPVAEADVYLAYGRDLQAEEILKEAMRTSPSRVAIHSKLMEIYAKRRDSSAFENIANEAFKLTQGSGPEWEAIAEMGRELDPGNGLYQPDGQPGGPTAAIPAVIRPSVPDVAAINRASTAAQIPPSTPSQPAAAATAAASDIDLDLDFSLGDEEPAPPAVAAVPSAFGELDMNFGDATVAISPPPSAKPAKAEAPIDFSANALSFSAESFTATTPVVTPARATAKAAPAPTADNGMLEFDLGALSLDLDATTVQSPSTGADNPLETKFQLAEEFRSLGDTEGARTLAQEVLAVASGPLKVKAQAFLNGLS